MSTQRLLRRVAVLSATVGTACLAAAGVASAHVTANVYGDQPEKGGYGAIVLRVPNEEEQFGTTKVQVTFAKEYKISSARTKPVPGWTAEVAKTGDAVSGITWTAQPGHEITAGSTSYQEFAFTAGPLPKNVDRLVLPAAQTYSNGTVVNWDTPPPDNGEEPEHPAPVVELTEPSGSGHGGGDHAAEAADTSDDTARWLGGAGLVVGVLGLGVGTGAAIRARKRASAQ